MARRKNQSNIGCLIFVVLFFVVLFGALISAIVREQQAINNRAYTETMSALFEPDSIPVTGEKAVSYIVDETDDDFESTFSKDFVPEGYTTDTPSDVRYIIYCTKDADMVGTYSNGGGIGMQRWSYFEILDRQTGSIIGSETFKGSYPPSTIRSNSGGKHYGSSPDESKIMDWITAVIDGKVTVFAQVPTDWNAPACWVWNYKTGMDAFNAWPGESMSRNGDWYEIEVPSWINYVIINGNGGSVQTEDLPVDSARNVWVVVAEDGTAEVFYKAPGK